MYEEFYNRHYITTRPDGSITDTWSDGPHPEKDTADAICINEQGGYQFRMPIKIGFIEDSEFPAVQESEENPTIYTQDGIPLYVWINNVAVQRSEDELNKDRLPSLISAKEQEIRIICHEAIVKGFDVGDQHFSLEETDQLNLTTAVNAIKNGATRYPYHSDGNACRMYTADEINKITQAATFHKLYHTTLCNHILQQLKRVKENYQLLAIAYSPECLSSDLRENFSSIMTAAQAL